MVAEFLFKALALLACFLYVESILYRFAKRRGMCQARSDIKEHELARQEERNRLLGVVDALLRLVDDLRQKVAPFGQKSVAWYETIGAMVEFVDPWQFRLQAELAALERALVLLKEAESIAPCDVERYAMWLGEIYWEVTFWQRDAANRVFFSPTTYCEVAGPATECWVSILTEFDTPRISAVGSLGELIQECTRQYQQSLRNTRALLLDCLLPQATIKSFRQAMFWWSKEQALTLLLAAASAPGVIGLDQPDAFAWFLSQFSVELERRILDDLGALHGAYLYKMYPRLLSM
jgi:hypothetical protein